MYKLLHIAVNKYTRIKSGQPHITSLYSTRSCFDLDILTIKYAYVSAFTAILDENRVPPYDSILLNITPLYYISLQMITSSCKALFKSHTHMLQLSQRYQIRIWAPPYYPTLLQITPYSTLLHFTQCPSTRSHLSILKITHAYVSVFTVIPR